MGNNRALDLIVLVALIACGTYLFRETRPAATPPAPPAVAATATPGARMAPAFELPDVDGKLFAYPGERGPALITLTAVGCGGCQQRVPTDREAVALAHARGIPVWNMFVYSSPEGGKAFREQYHPEADFFLADPDGKVAVTAYGGSDESCWILIGPAGDIVWQGGSDLKALQQAWEGFPAPATSALTPATP